MQQRGCFYSPGRSTTSIHVSESAVITQLPLVDKVTNYRWFTKVKVLLLPGEHVRLHHVHEVFGRSVSVSRHVDHGERFAHSEEVHLLRVALRRKHKERKTNSEQDVSFFILNNQKNICILTPT